GGKGGAVDGHVVQCAVEGLAGSAGHAGADDQVIRIRDRRAVGDTGEGPDTLDRATVDVALQAVTLSEGVGHGDVVPGGRLLLLVVIAPPDMELAVAARPVMAGENET